MLYDGLGYLPYPPLQRQADSTADSPLHSSVFLMLALRHHIYEAVEYKFRRW